MVAVMTLVGVAFLLWHAAEVSVSLQVTALCFVACCLQWFSECPAKYARVQSRVAHTYLSASQHRRLRGSLLRSAAFSPCLSTKHVECSSAQQCGEASVLFMPTDMHGTARQQAGTMSLCHRSSTLCTHHSCIGNFTCFLV